MTAVGWFQIIAFALVVLAITRPVGSYLFRVFEGENKPLPRVFGPVERLVNRLCGVDPKQEQTWVQYTASLLVFSAIGVLVTYGLERLQLSLPLNPQKLAGVEPALAFNTASSFVTNTNWQAYPGESTMSYLTQMAGLAWHNFTSAASGIGVALALARGLTRRPGPGGAKTLGNFWVDVNRAILYVLLPFSLVVALFLVSQGVIQNLSPYLDVTTVEGVKQTLALGPVASQEAIKELGTNGGGFFNANSAHPFENPSPLTNFVELVLIFAIPAALTYCYGKMARDTRQGWVLLAAMSALFLAGVTVCYWAESRGNPALSGLGVGQPLGNMEGKEVRFGVAASTLFATVTTDASCGAVNSMHDSFTPLGGLVPLVNIQLGEVIFGGVGAGLYGMLIFVVLSVFIAGLMVGRTPEYLGKKIEAKEMKLAMLYVLVFPLIILGLTAWSAVRPYGISSLNNAGPHGLSEMLYAYSSGSGNNGSAFAGLNANTPWWNVTLAVAMLGGRFLMIIPALGIAGSMIGKKTVLPGPGTFPTDGGLFAVLLVSVVVIVGALTFFPALSLGPIVEHYLAGAGRVYLIMSAPTRQLSLFDPSILRGAAVDSLRKLAPAHVAKNPVMFVVEVGSLLTTALWIRELFLPAAQRDAPLWFTAAVSLWLWFTVVFANFAEAVAEGRGKAQANSLRKMRKDTLARKLVDGKETQVSAATLRKGDQVVVVAGQVIPGDGEVIEGIASVDESAITGESAPVIRESGGDRSAVTGGTKVLSDRIVVRITSNPGESFLDRMISLVEGASRQKTPNEIALHILLVGLTLIFLFACVTLVPLALYSGVRLSATVIVALLVCLIPTTIGGLLSAIGIAGMDRLLRKNVIAMSGRAVEAAGDVDTLLLDKTGTITLGNRMASEFVPLPGVNVEDLAGAAQLASLADETPEGRSIVVLAKEKHGLRGRELADQQATFIAFSAHTRMSGLDTGTRSIRKGAVDAVAKHVTGLGGAVPPELDAVARRIAETGGTPLAVAEGNRVLGVVHLKDTVKGGIAERFARFRAMGIRTVMITGDNPRTAEAIAREAGVDDFLAEATPETKMQLIKDEQAKGKLVAMTGDGTNDAPALAQADVGVAMNTGTQAAKEAGNMVDLDSNPTKLLEVVEVGKQLLMTRGTLTTFSIANDVAKYFAILPALFMGVFPEIAPLNVMQLASPNSAILSAVIFNALVIIALIPLALRGVKYRPLGAGALLKRSLLVYGLGGVVVPFVGIKIIDLALQAAGLV